MGITRPTGEQLRFVSQYTGDQVLDTYLEAAEKGGRSLPDLLDDLFDNSGVFRTANFEFRFDTSSDKLQVRVGNFSNSTSGWTDLTTFFKITGAYSSSSTTYNNFDLLTLSNKDVYIVHGLSAGTTFADEAAVIASSNTSKLVDVSEARDWAMKTDGQVASTDYSAKAWSIGGTGVTDTASKGAAKEWATKTSGTVDGTNYSAKYWATNANVGTVAGAVTNINTVASGIANVNTVASDITNVNTTAGSIANVNTVAGGIGSGQVVTVVAGSIANVTTVAGAITNVNTVAGANANITTVATEINNNKLQTVANNINAVVTAADDLNEATSEIDTVATNIANVNTVGGISANVTTVAGISTNVTTVAGISASVTTLAGIHANITTVANLGSSVTTAANNVAAFNNTYLGAQSSAPTQDPDGSALDVGDLYFDTTSNTMKVRASSGWVNASSTVNGTSNRFTFTATSGQTTFTGADANGNTLAYDSGFMDVYMNGVKLAAADFTATNGTSVVIAAAAAGDTLEMIAYGTFSLANVDINDLTNVNTTGVANHSILAYNSSNTRFEPTATPTFTSITVSGTVDGRDVSADGTKLDTVETNADVTDATNVTAAGALMDSELTNIAALKALNQGLATTDEPSFDNTTLNAIATDIADTATDIFVYDTSKDSDGGAWRHRTQHTSWYNEAASATRGSRKEFPSVAVIVSEYSAPRKVTIYDGDDPDMPMWMVFNQPTDASVNFMASSGKSVSSVRMLNGSLCIGFDLGGWGISQIGFLSDTQRWLWSSSIYRQLTNTVAERNVGGSPGYVQTETYGLPDGIIHDIDMTILDSAPIDAATGLPVPTVLAATDRGVCIVKDNNTVVDINDSLGIARPVEGIVVRGNDVTIYNVNNGTIQQYFDALSLASDSTQDCKYNYTGGGGGGSTENISAIHRETFGVPMIVERGETYRDLNVGNSDGITKVHDGYDRDFSTSSFSIFDSSVAYITSEYNTGWMNGDMRLATLSDTDTTSATGAELITNGTFDSNTTGWTANNGATLSVSSSQLVVTCDGASSTGHASQSITTVVGKTYAVVADFIGGTAANARIIAGTSVGGTQNGILLAGNGTRNLTFVATATTTYISMQSWGSVSQTRIFDNVSVRLAEEDRSLKRKGLQVYGTVTKDVLATGAELVGYSGFSSSNYLKQCYNSELDFGTGDFTYAFWCKASASGNDRIWLCHGRYYTANSGLNVLQYNSGGSGDEAQFYVGAPSSGIVTVTGIEGRGWLHWVATRRSGTLYVYRNGEFEGSGAAPQTVNLSNETDQDLILGVGKTSSGIYGNGAEALTLFRVSGTAMSPEQIKKMYEDEKVLFQENAKATLYGSSNIITALAYDDTTDLLHAGTSAGRSVFQGLRRVDNTTDAVGAAISASNGLVAEE